MNHTTESKTRDWPVTVAVFVTLLTTLFYWYNVKYGFPAMLQLATPCALLATGWLARGRVYQAKLEYAVGFAFFVWYIATRWFNGDFLLDNARFNTAFLCMALCVALPFAGTLSSRGRHRALTAVGVTLVGFLAIIAWLSVYAVLTRQSLQLPFATFPIELDTEMRLQVWQTHANITGGLFTAGCLIALYHLLTLKHRAWLTAPVALACLGFYLAVGLTVSRTAMACLALGLGAAAALPASRFLRRQSLPIRRLAAVGVMMIVALAAYKGYGWTNEGITALSNRLLTPKASSQSISTAPETTANAADVVLESASTGSPLATLPTTDPGAVAAPDGLINSGETLVPQRGLLDQWWTLNGRTDIYEAVFRAAAAHPMTLIRGNLDGTFMDWVNAYLPVSFAHTHNAVLQTMMTTGLPGMALMLWWIVLLARRAYRLLRNPAHCAADVLLVTVFFGILADAMMEPLIFTYYGMVNLLFFLYSGMLIERSAELSDVSLHA